MKISYVTVSVLIIALNLLTILSHCVIYQVSKQPAFLILPGSVNLSDASYAAYLSVLAIADNIYQGQFSVKQQTWVSSSTCFAAFGLLYNFNTLCPFFLLLLSLSRLMVVIHPIESKFKKAHFALRCTLAAFGFSIFFTGLTILVMKATKGKLPANLCSPFVDPTGSFHFLMSLT